MYKYIQKKLLTDPKKTFTASEESVNFAQKIVRMAIEDPEKLDEIVCKMIKEKDFRREYIDIFKRAYFLIDEKNPQDYLMWQDDIFLRMAMLDTEDMIEKAQEEDNKPAEEIAKKNRSYLVKMLQDIYQEKIDNM